jgi:hypothetical protein
VSDALAAEGDEGYAVSGLQRDGTIWSRITWIGTKRTVNLITSAGTPPDSMKDRKRVEMIALSARNTSSKAAILENAR